MKTKKDKKLALNRETLRRLSDRELQRIAAASGAGQNSGCGTCTCMESAAETHCCA